MADRTVRVRLEAITDAYRREMDKAAGATQKLIEKAGGLEGIGQKMQSVGGSMTRNLTLPIAAAMGVAVKSASDLQQAIGGTAAVFGEAGDIIDKYAEKAARASGLSEREFREATTSIGGQLKRMTGDVNLAAEQSVKLTEVAADLAATYGGTTKEAVDALGSAFRGEADPAERFNLNLKIGAVNAKAVEMGLAATTSEVDENARAQATLALILEQSADAQGQFAREAGSAAGSMQIARAELENASAEIGTALLPMVSQLAGTVADLAQGFSELPPGVQNAVVAFAGILAVTGPLIGVTGKLVESYKALGRAGGPLAAAGIAIAAGAWAYSEATKAGREYDSMVDDLKTSLAPVATGQADLNTELENFLKLQAEGLGANQIDTLNTLDVTLDDIQQSIREGGDALDPLRQAFRDMGADLQGLDVGELDNTGEGRKVLRELGREFGFSGDALYDLINNIEDWDDAAQDSAKQTLDLAIANDDLTQAEVDAAVAANTAADGTINYAGALADVAPETKEAAEGTEGFKEEVEKAVTPTLDLAEGIRGVASALRAQMDPMFAAQDAILGITEAQLDVAEAEHKARQAQVELNDAIKEYGRNSPEAYEASLNLEAANRDLADAERDAAGAALDYDTALLELKAAMESGETSYDTSIATLQRWQDEGLLTEAQAQRMKDELGLAALAAASLDEQSIYVPIRLDTSQWLKDITAFYAQNPDVPVSLGLGGQPSLDTGGPIPGPKGAPVPILAHGGEFMLSANVVDAIKNGNPTSGLVMGGSTGGTNIDQRRSVGEQHIHFHGKDAPDPLAALAWAVA